MNKRYLFILIILTIVIFVFWYLIMKSPSYNVKLNEQPGKNNSQNLSQTQSGRSYTNSSSQTSNNSPSGGGGEGGVVGGRGGGSPSSGNVTTETQNYTTQYLLDIVSTPSGFEIITFYYYNGTFSNYTQSTPYSLYVDANSTVCMAEATGYSGIWWQVDGATYNMSRCYSYSNGCVISMNNQHEVRMRQNS